MSAAATVPQPALERPDPARVREELAASYTPANAHERMLTANIAQSWLRLQRAYDLEQRFTEAHDLFDVLGSNIEQFKALTRYVTDCERAWRHAVDMLETAQKRREAASRPPPEKRSSTKRQQRHPPPENWPDTSAPVLDIASPQRE